VVTSSPSGSADDATLPADNSEPTVRPGEGLRRGSTLGRYLVLERVGAGGMGEVYAAYDPELDRKVAIKLLHAQPQGSSGSSEGAGRLLREAQAMARLTHPNVITVHDVGTLDGQVFVAMEYVEGTTLKDWMEGEHETPEVLELFSAAGRGLASAHAAGLVHRDFKPENVLLGKDGRVLVADFGLARAASNAQDPGTETQEEIEEKLETSVPSLEWRLTQTGAIMGTPAYMSPEQHLGGLVDEGSDQFAFCVALYEALYEQRPFGGESFAALSFQVVQGKVREPPSGVRVPGRVKRAVVRGLSRKRADRYPTMSALLADLDPGRSGSRTGWAIVAGLGLLALAAGVGLSGRAVTDPCPSAESRFDGVWDEVRKETVHSAFSATNLSFAEGAWSPVQTTLDQFRDDWVAMHDDACEATHVRGEQSAAMLDARMACLNGRFEHVASLVEVLEQPDTATVVKAGQMASNLPAVAYCGETEALAARVPPPEDPETRQAVEDMRAEFARVSALLTADKVEESFARAEPLVDRAHALEYLPVEAEALFLRGSARMGKDMEEEGEADFTASIEAALASGHDEYIVRAAIGLVRRFSERQGRFKEADFQHGLARAALERLGGDEQLETKLLLVWGGSLYRRGDVEAAREPMEAALNRLIELHGEDDPRVVTGHIGISSIMYGLGDYDAMSKHIHRAIELNEEHYGPDSPLLAAPLNNLAVVHIVRSEFEQAIPILERVIALRTAELGPDHIRVIDARSNLGISLESIGRYEEAEKHLRLVADTYKERYGTENRDYGEGLLNLAKSVYYTAGPAESRKVLLEAEQVFEKAEHGSGIRLAQVINELAEMDRLEGDFDSALSRGTRALEIGMAALRPDHPSTFNMRAELAKTHLAMGNRQAVIDTIEPYLEKYAEAGDLETLSRAQWVLARALVDEKDQHKRAVDLAQKALANLKGTDAHAEHSAEDVERWLAKHR
jgi:tetratricopeptide (TPR) repeat protein